MKDTTEPNAALRLLEIYFKFYNGGKFATIDLAEQYKKSRRTIQRDIEEINKYTSTKIINDRSTHTWSMQDNSNMLLTKDEQFTLNVLDQACVEQGEQFHQNALKLFDKFKNSLHNTIYNNIDSEDIATIKEDLAKAENAVYTKNKISLTYKNKDRIVEPLKLANFEGYWYLLVEDLTDNRIKTFYFKDISNLKILDEKFIQKDKTIQRKLKNAINTYFTFDATPYEIKLLVSKDLASIIKRKPLAPSQRMLNTYDDGSFEVSITITNDMEIIPKIQQFMPHLKIINDDEHSQRILDSVFSNLEGFKQGY